MANKKITDLVEITSAANADVLPIVDVSADTTNKIQVANLPINTATQTALDGKQATLVSGTNIKTINSTSLLGSGDIAIAANPGGSDTQVQFNSSGSFGGSANLTFDGSTLISTGGGSSTSNTAVGSLALLDNTTGTNNTALGKSALENNTASNNTAVGYEAALSNTSGTGITAVGYQALNASISNNNTAFGYQAALAITTSSNNTAVGYSALKFNTTGGGQNSAFGYQSLINVTTSLNNTGCGYNAGVSLTSGSSNTFLGASANIGSGTQSFGTAIGASATTNDSGVTIGASATSAGFTSCVVLGRQATATGNNQFVVGSATYNAGTIDSNSFTQGNRWKVKINGTDYWIPLELA